MKNNEEMRNVEDRVMEVLHKMLPVKEYGVSLSVDTDLIEDLSTDSILLMQVIAVLESEFDIEFDFDLDNEILRRVGRLREYIVSKVKEKQ